MGRLDKNARLKNHLLENKPFRYAHLVKFERPSPTDDDLAGNQGYLVEKDATKYAYLTDVAFNIDFKDGSTNLAGVANDTQTYVANKVMKVGSIVESTDVKINSTSLTLDATAVNVGVKKEYVFNDRGYASGDLAGSAILYGEKNADIDEEVNWVEEGFKEGDKISVPFGQATVTSTETDQLYFGVSTITAANIGNDYLVSGEGIEGYCKIVEWSGSTPRLNARQYLEVGTVLTLYNTYRVDSFRNEGLTMYLTYLDGELNPGTRTHNNTNFQSVHLNPGVKVLSEEINYLLQGTMPSNYVNRNVWIYKVFLGDENANGVPDYGTIIADPSSESDDVDGDEAVLLFKGIITSASYKESGNRATMTWSCKSHWGDFQRVSGRLTSKDFHQALDADLEPNAAATIKQEYAGDYGFWWADRAVNLLARYTTQVKEQKMVDINGWWAGGKRLKDYYVDVEREVDLRFDLNAKYLPTVYGVRRLTGNPVFADIGAVDADTVYIADVLCEGPIQGVLNIYLEDQSLVCVDGNDSSSRGSASSDIVCYGRMDNGEIFHGIANGGSRLSESGLNDLPQISEAQEKAEQHNNDNIMSVSLATSFQPRQYSSVSTMGTNAGGGIPHERTIGFSTPMTMEMEFHNGVEGQEASSMLASHSAGQGFRLQKDFYSGGEKLPYWGSNHKLLDTAYVARKTVLADGETTVPKVEYTVAGKLISCYNYDNSFAHDSNSAYNSESSSPWKLGTTVDIKRPSDDTDLATGVVISDKFINYTPTGHAEYRFRWDISSSQAAAMTAAQKFYMSHSTHGSWHMEVHNSVEISSLTVAEIGVSQVDNSNTTGANQLVYPLADSAPGGFSDYFSGDTVVQFIEAGTITSANYRNNRVRSANVLATLSGSNLTFTNVNSQDKPDPNFANNILVTNKLTLGGSGISSSDDAYNDKWIEITKTKQGGNQKVLRRIKDYVASTNVVTLYEPFQSSIDMPQQGDSVRILNNSPYSNSTSRGAVTSVAGTDIRMSTNPALILLDYMTDVRYGPNVSLDDIDLDSFLYAAQVCDTRSDIIVKLQDPTTNPAVGEVYKYVNNNTFFWQGTVSAFNATTNEVTFTNNIGKLTNRWNNWKKRKKGEIIYSASEVVKTIYRFNSNTDAAQTTAVTNNATVLTGTDFGITKVSSGTGDSTLNIVLGAGNPVTYSLYDSDDCKYWAYLGWTGQDQRWVTRHQANMKIENSATVFDNMKGILGHFNGMLTHSDGKYKLSVEVKRTVAESDTNFVESSSDKDIKIRYITDDDIIGNVSIKDTGLDKSFNSLSANLPDPFLHFNNRTVSFFDSNYLRQDRGVVKSTNFNASGITNYFNARIMVKQKLDQSRFNRSVTFDMRPSGVNISAGDLIRIESSRFGWESAKLFRTKSITLKDNCNVSITAE